MIVFIPAPAAEALSDALWALVRPEGLREAKDSRYLFPWKKDVNGQIWIIVETDCEIRIHEEAVLNGIADILAPHVGHGIDQSEIDALVTFVENNRGQTVKPYIHFPAFFQAQSKTYQQMFDAGLLNLPSFP